MENREGPGSTAWSGRVWLWAVVWALGLSVVWALLAGRGPATPTPQIAIPWFWLFWSPVTVAAILGFLTSAGGGVPGSGGGPRRFVPAASTLAPFAVAAVAGLVTGGRSGDAATLTAAHLPIVATACLELALTSGSTQVADDRFAALTKALEILVAAAILFAILGVAGALTVGIFGVLGVTLPLAVVQTGANMALGIIPVPAVAAAYDPTAAPRDQDLSGGTLRWLRLFSRLALVPVLIILAAYVLWFIPHFFWRAFQDRAVLIVYNATVVAVLALLVLVLPAEGEHLPQGLTRTLRRGVLAVAAATFLLNLYALAANAERAFRLGLTANRHVVLGWNLVTLFILSMVLMGQVRWARSRRLEGGGAELGWTATFRRSFATGLPVAAIWSLWVALASPLLW